MQTHKGQREKCRGVAGTRQSLSGRLVAKSQPSVLFLSLKVNIYKKVVSFCRIASSTFFLIVFVVVPHLKECGKDGMERYNTQYSLLD